MIVQSPVVYEDLHSPKCFMTMQFFSFDYCISGEVDRKLR